MVRFVRNFGRLHAKNITYFRAREDKYLASFCHYFGDENHRCYPQGILPHRVGYWNFKKTRIVMAGSLSLAVHNHSQKKV